MKNFKANFPLLVFLLGCLSLNAQMSFSLEDSNHTYLSQDNNKLYFLVKESFPLNAAGQLFLEEKWEEGIVTDFQDNQFKIPLRYRSAKEEMQVQHNNKTKALQIQQIKKITLRDKVFIASDYLLNEEKFMSFFEVVSNGKMKLLIQYESKEKKGTYTIHKTYFSKKEKAPAEKISFKKKYILKLMQDNKSAVQQFIKKDKINLKKSDDLEKLFMFYNSL